MSYRFVFTICLLFIVSVSKAQQPNIKALIDHKNFSPFLSQEGKQYFIFADDTIFVSSQEHRFVVRWDEFQKDILIRPWNSDDTHSLHQRKYLGKGTWICTVAGAGKKSKCFKRPK